MDRREYRKLQKEHDDKIYKKYEEELREEIKDWTLEKFRQEYIDIQLVRLIIAPFPPYDWFEIFEEDDEE